ncbi:MAG: nitrate ABC transporter ATP-binding protein [Cyanobacteriota bacterium]|nr:nitrate ABC transporter ATP-binding protein [Cyanobacteriota bacterium]
MAAPFLTVDNVTRSFSLPGGGSYVALRNIKLEVGRGEFISLVGHSGCGKSTLLNLMAGLDLANVGGILIEGRQVTEPGPERMVVFQNYSLLPWKTVRQNIALAVDNVMRQASSAQRLERIQRSLEMVGLAAAADRFPAELSGGMKQRVAIARGLALQPKLLLLDEPFGALDALTRGNLQEQLMQISQQAGVTTVMVTHDVDEALLLSDRVVMMTNGPEAGIGQILAVPFARPRHRLEVMEHGDYYQLRSELIGFLQQQRRLRQRRATPTAAVAVGVSGGGGAGAAAPATAMAGATAVSGGAGRLTPRSQPTRVRLGYLPGLDVAPLAMAQREGLLDPQLLQLIPVPFASWDRLEAALVDGDLQVAFLPATTPLLLNLGLVGRTPWPAITPLTLSRNGNAFCLERGLRQQGLHDRASLAAWLNQQADPLVLGVPQRFGIAELLLRHWLAAGGIDLERQVRFVSLSPLVMPGAVRTGEIQGFIAGRYRVAEAVENNQAFVLATDLDIWNGHPEKLLTCAESFAAAEPEALQELVAGLIKACVRCDDGGRRLELIDLLSQPQWLASRASIALQRHFDDGSGGPPEPGRMNFTRYHADQANYPNPAEGAWLLSQFCRWGLCPFPSNRVELLSSVYRTDLFNRAVERAGLALLQPGRVPFRLADGLAFDQDDPLAYLRSLGVTAPAQAPLPLPTEPALIR